MRLPTTLAPHEAARDVSLGAAALEGMRARGGAAAWVAGRSRAWLRYWREEIGS